MSRFYTIRNSVPLEGTGLHTSEICVKYTPEKSSTDGGVMDSLLLEQKKRPKVAIVCADNVIAPVLSRFWKDHFDVDLSVYAANADGHIYRSMYIASETPVPKHGHNTLIHRHQSSKYVSMRDLVEVAIADGNIKVIPFFHSASQVPNSPGEFKKDLDGLNTFKFNLGPVYFSAQYETDINEKLPLVVPLYGSNTETTRSTAFEDYIEKMLNPSVKSGAFRIPYSTSVAYAERFCEEIFGPVTSVSHGSFNIQLESERTFLYAHASSGATTRIGGIDGKKLEITVPKQSGTIKLITWEVFNPNRKEEKSPLMNFVDEKWEITAQDVFCETTQPPDEYQMVSRPPAHKKKRLAWSDSKLFQDVSFPVEAIGEIDTAYTSLMQLKTTKDVTWSQLAHIVDIVSKWQARFEYLAPTVDPKQIVQHVLRTLIGLIIKENDDPVLTPPRLQNGLNRYCSQRVVDFS